MTAATGPSKFSASTGTLPGFDGFAISPSDSANLTSMVRAIYVGGAGNIKLVSPNNTTLEFVGVPAGSILPMMAVKVFNTSTTASLLIGIM